jgi:hypothetical protein
VAKNGRKSVTAPPKRAKKSTQIIVPARAKKNKNKENKE